MHRPIAVVLMLLIANVAVGQDARPPRTLDEAQKRVAELERANRVLESRLRLLTEQVKALRESNEALAAALKRHTDGAGDATGDAPPADRATLPHRAPSRSDNTDAGKPDANKADAGKPAAGKPVASETDASKPGAHEADGDTTAAAARAKRLREYRSALGILRDLPFAARPRAGGQWDDDNFKRAGDWLARRRNPFESALTVKSVRIARLRDDEQRRLETTETHRADFEFEIREWDHLGLTVREEVTGVTLLGGQDLIRGAERITKGSRLRVSGTIKNLRLQSNVANGSIKELSIQLEKPMVHSNFLRAWMEKQ